MSILTGRDTRHMNPGTKAFLYLVSLSFAPLLSWALFILGIVLSIVVSHWLWIPTLLAAAWFVAATFFNGMVVGRNPMPGESARSFARKQALAFMSGDIVSRPLIAIAGVCLFMMLTTGSLWWLIGIIVPFALVALMLEGLTHNDATAYEQNEHYAYMGFYKGPKDTASDA